jgi:hypothetical protein
VSSEDDELPAVYRALSDEGLLRLRDSYEERLRTARTEILRELYRARLTYIGSELARRAT